MEPQNIFFGTQEECEKIKHMLKTANHGTVEDARRHVNTWTVKEDDSLDGWLLCVSGDVLKRADSEYLSAFAEGFNHGIKTQG